jgi:hypothetical protein
MLLAELVPERLFGLPAHPLLVHVPVVLVPLAALGAVAALARGPWRTWLLPLTAGLAAAAIVGVQLAMSSGEGLEEAGESGGLVERHSQLAEQTRPLVLVFCLLAIAAAVVHHRLGRDSEAPQRSNGLTRALVPLMAASVLFGGLATTWVIRTGHTGARSVWDEKSEEGDEGRDERGRDRDGDRNVDRDRDGDEAPSGD